MIIHHLEALKLEDLTDARLIYLEKVKVKY